MRRPRLPRTSRPRRSRRRTRRRAPRGRVGRSASSLSLLPGTDLEVVGDVRLEPVVEATLHSGVPGVPVHVVDAVLDRRRAPVHARVEDAVALAPAVGVDVVVVALVLRDADRGGGRRPDLPAELEEAALGVDLLAGDRVDALEDAAADVVDVLAREEFRLHVHVAERHVHVETDHGRGEAVVLARDGSLRGLARVVRPDADLGLLLHERHRGARLEGRPGRRLAVAEGVAIRVLVVLRAREAGHAGERHLRLVVLAQSPRVAHLRAAVAEVAGAPHREVGVDEHPQRGDEVVVLSGHELRGAPVELQPRVAHAERRARLGLAREPVVVEVDLELAGELRVLEVLHRAAVEVEAEPRQARVHREVLVVLVGAGGRAGGAGERRVLGADEPDRLRVVRRGIIEDRVEAEGSVELDHRALRGRDPLLQGVLDRVAALSGGRGRALGRDSEAGLEFGDPLLEGLERGLLALPRVRRLSCARGEQRQRNGQRRRPRAIPETDHAQPPAGSGPAQGALRPQEIYPHYAGNQQILCLPSPGSPAGGSSRGSGASRAPRSTRWRAGVHSVPMSPRVPLARAAAFSALVVVALGAVPAAADTQAVSETPYEDTSVGYSIKPMRGWEPKPRKNPGDPGAQI